MPTSTFPSSTTLIPHPPFSLTLAPLDNLHPEHYSCRLLIFHCSSPQQREAQLSTLKTGLKRLVSQCPILGGKVVPLSSSTTDGHFTIIPSSGLEFIVKDLSSQSRSMKELEKKTFAPSLLLDKLLNPIIGREEEGAACKVQYTAIDGGTILSWVVSHRVCDGSGTNELMKILAQEMKNASSPSDLDGDREGQGQEEVKERIGLDRSLLRNITSTLPFDIKNHPAYNLPSPTPSQKEEPHPFTALHPEKSLLLDLSPAALANLKADASSPGPSETQISTHDALLSLIWRSTMMIRSQRSPTTPIQEITSKIFFPSDARRHLGLDRKYVGNAVYQLTASLPLSVLLGADGVSSAAQAIRTAIKSVDSEKVTNYMTRLNNEGWIDWGFLQGTNNVNVALGTDWTSGMLYELDFGSAWGRVQRFRYPGDEGAFCCIFPKLRDGGAEVEVACLEGEEEEWMRGERGWGRYLSIK